VSQSVQGWNSRGICSKINHKRSGSSKEKQILWHLKHFSIRKSSQKGISMIYATEKHVRNGSKHVENMWKILCN